MTLTMSIDMMQTLSPGTYEANPILGRHPTDSEIVAYFAGMLATRALITWVLPPRWSHAFQGVFIVHDVGFIINNRLAGVRISF